MVIKYRRVRVGHLFADTGLFLVPVSHRFRVRDGRLVLSLAGPGGDEGICRSAKVICGLRLGYRREVLIFQNKGYQQSWMNFYLTLLFCPWIITLISPGRLTRPQGIYAFMRVASILTGSISTEQHVGTEIWLGFFFCFVFWSFFFLSGFQ